MHLSLLVSLYSDYFFQKDIESHTTQIENVDWYISNILLVIFTIIAEENKNRFLTHNDSRLF